MKKDMGTFGMRAYRKPEVTKEIKKRELKLENLINKYRIFLFTFFVVADFTVMILTGKFSEIIVLNQVVKN